MPGSIVLSKKNEYFLSIAKQGMHSFMMLGVVKDGKPTLLARVGKSADVDIAPSIRKLMFSGVLARITDEDISRREDHVVNINYQAYAINYDQLKEFLGIIAVIEKKQLENPEIQEGIKRLIDEKQRQWEIETEDMQLKANKMQGEEAEKINLEVKERQGLSYDREYVAIKCYVPVQESIDNDLVTFHHKKLKEFEFLTDEEFKGKIDIKATPKIISGAQRIHVNNTCRTSSKNIVEAVLGFATDVSKYFFISPKYESKLASGQPQKESFYILPLPPNTVDVGAEQASVLKKLYKRIEEIPKLNPESNETRKKFDALKTMYKDIAGENKLSAKDLLGKILEHEDKNQNSLFEKRSPNFLSRFFSISSSTKTMFDDIKSSFKKTISTQEFNEIKNNLKGIKNKFDHNMEEDQENLTKPLMQ